MDDVSAATLSLLRALNVAAAPRSVSGYVTAHPAYPSLAALVDCLAELGVRASARRIAFDALSSVPAPALIHVRDGAGSGTFWLVNGYAGGAYDCTLPSGERRAVPESEVADRYLGVAVSGVPEPGAGERYADRNELGDRLRSRLPLAAVALFGVAMAGSIGAASHAPALVAYSLAFALSGWLGLAASLFLSLRDLLDGSGVVSKLCPTGKTFNCAAVVGSEGGYVAKVIPLADVAATLFLTQLAAGAAAALTESLHAFFLLWLSSAVVLVPVMIRSLVLQAFVIRRWCALCLVVNATLAAQLALAAGATGFDWTALAALDPRSGLQVGAAALAAALAYALVRPLVTPALAAPRLYGELEALRAMPETLGGALARSPAIASDVSGKLLEGNAAAPLEILVVSHPFCVACADAHLALERLIRAFPKLARGATIFAVADGDHAAASAARSLLAGELEPGDWYARVNENVANWVQKNGHDALALDQRDVLASQTAFAERAAVTSTPAVFVNGQRLRKGYELRHLRFWLRAEQRRQRHLETPARESA
jgi:uncharacterized membrane protein